MNELFESVLSGEHGEDLSPAEAEAFEAWLESDRGREALAAAEGELDPLAESFDPAQPSSEAWAEVEAKISAAVRQGVTESGVIVRAPVVPAEHNWGGLALLAAGLLFVAAIGLLSMGPGPDQTGKNPGTAMVTPAAPVVQPLAATPKAPLAPANGPAARVGSLEAGEGYEAASAIVQEALLVITVQTKAK